MSASEQAKLKHVLALQEEFWALTEKRDLPGAETCCREALALQEEIDGPVHPDVANLLQSLASILDMRGRHDEAEVCARRAVAIMDEVAHLVEGTEAVCVHVQALGQLGTALRQQGRYSDARKELEIALGYNRLHSTALYNLRLVSQLDDKPAAIGIQPVRPFWARWGSVMRRAVAGPIAEERKPVSTASAGNGKGL